MKTAIITPYYKENTDVLRRCHESVLNQTYKDVTHIMVADGYPHPWCQNQNIEHIILPKAHNDAGATPRAIAAISAFSRGYDAIGFLDADNWIDPDHVEQMVSALGSTNSVVSATRRIHSLEGPVLYTDTWESNGKDFTDTNCLFLKNDTLNLLTKWVTASSRNLWSDRAFWDSIVQSDLNRVICQKPTVAYVTKWAAHYVSAKVVPPLDSVWIGYAPDGSLIHIKHKDSMEYTKYAS